MSYGQYFFALSVLAGLRPFNEGQFDQWYVAGDRAWGVYDLKIFI